MPPSTLNPFVPILKPDFQAYAKVSGGLDQHVIPIIELIMSNDVVEFIPYVLQLIGTVYTPILISDHSLIDPELSVFFSPNVGPK